MACGQRRLQPARGIRRGMGSLSTPLAEPFVGRIAELATLSSVIERASSGRGQVVLITGPVGIGKTALVRAALRMQSGAAVIMASGDSDERSLSGGLLDQLAQDVLAQVPGLAQARELRDLARAAGPDQLAAGSALLRAIEALASVARPAVVIADDAQWGDEISLRALSFAARRLAAAPAVCIVIIRPEDLAELPAGLRRAVDDRGTRLDLGPLDVADVARLAELTGVGELPRRAAQRLREHAAGVPLHVTELLHDLPGDVLRAPRAELPAPRSLETLVLSRLAACAPETERLVIAAAVLGRDSRLADAAALAGLADPLPALQEATRARLLEERGPAERRCAFGHELIRAAVYRDIGVSRRAELHRRAASLTAGAAALAHRAAGCQAADPDLAAELRAQASAELAAGRRAEAAESLLTAVQVQNPGPDRDWLLLAALSLMADLGDAARLRAYAAEVRAMPPSPPRSVVLSRLAMLSGEYGQAEDLLSDAWLGLSAAGPRGSSGLQEGTAAAACQLALMLIGQQRFDDAVGWARRARETAVTSFTRACSCAVQGGSLTSAGRSGEAQELLEGELIRHGDGPGAALLRMSLASTLYRCDDLAGARAQLDAARADGSHAALPMAHLLDAALIWVAVDYRTGRWDRARDEAERLVLLIDDLDQAWLLPRARLLAVHLAAGRGDWTRAVSHCAAAAAQLSATTGAGALDLADAQAALAAARGDPDGIIAAVRPLGELGRLTGMEPTRLMFWPAYAGALAQAGQPGLAERVLRPFEELARARQRRSALGAAARARGNLESARQEPAAARAAFEASIAALDGLGMPFELARSRLDYGRFLRRAGQRRAALRELSAARQAFAGLGAWPFASRCEGELGHDTSAAPAAADLPLTSRQLAVARAVATGKSNRDVAAELYVSVKTVEFHVSQILARLGIDSRADIAAALGAGGGELSTAVAARRQNHRYADS